MEPIQLEAKTRDVKSSPRALRKVKLIPAVFYGKKEKSVPLQMEYQDFRKVFMKAGSNQVVDLHINGKKTNVLIHDVQYHPLTDAISHVDFLHVDLSVEVTTHVPVVIVGVAPAVKNFSGILTTVKHELTVKCLPMDIPHEITVDISTLEQLSSSIHIKDLEVPKGVQFMDNVEDVIVTVSAPRVEEETPAPVGLEGTAEAAAAAADAAKAAAAEAEGAAGKKKEKE